MGRAGSRWLHEFGILDEALARGVAGKAQLGDGHDRFRGRAGGLVRIPRALALCFDAA